MSNTNNLTTKEVQELIDMTPEQLKAFKALERAYKKCEKLGICFYNHYGHLTGFNGKHIRCIENIESTEHEYGCPRDLNLSLRGESFVIEQQWTDDTHVLILKGDL